MALSGSFYKNVSSHWRVRCTWSGTQSISGNYTDVTLKVYWESIDSYGTTYTSDTKSGTSTIYNYNSSGSDDKDSFTFSAKLTGKDSTLVHTQTTRVYHNADGTKSFSMSASLSIELTLNGTYYGTVTASSGTITLNTIPRASTLSSSASWTAGNNLAISISRASSSFTHTVNIYVNGVKIKTLTGVGSSATASFTVSENTSIFNQLNTGASQDTKVEVITYSGGTRIGTTSKTGTVTAPSASTAKITNPAGVSDTAGQEDSTVWIDQTITLSITRANSGFTHTVRFKDSNSGSIVKEFTNVGTSVSWTPTATEQQTLYSKCPNSNEFDGQIDVITYYNGEQVRTATNTDINYRVRNSNPQFSANSISYADTNSSTKTLTGNDQLIIQNKSTLTVSVNSPATAINGANFSHYIVTVDGKQKTINSQTGSVNVGTISAGTNVTLKVTAVDSRGNQTSVTKTVTVIPYTSPVNTVTVSRVNSFENTTLVKVNGTFSQVLVGGTPKNTLQTLVFHYKEKGTSTWSSDVAMVFTVSNGTFTATTAQVDLDNTKAWDFEIISTDSMGSQTTTTTSVGTGQPIFFIDVVKKSIGVGKFPSGTNSLETAGDVTVGGNLSVAGAIVGDVYINGDTFINGDMTVNNKVLTSQIMLTSQYDASATSTNNALIIGFPTVGDSLKFDTNEISAYSDGATSSLHFNPDGGTVTINNTVKYTANSNDIGLLVYNKTELHGDGGNILNLYGNTHGYIQFFVKGTSTRSGWLGIGSSTTNDFCLNAENRNLKLTGSGTDFYLGNDGSPRIWSMDIYNRTYSSGATVTITSSGTLGRISSSLKYKTQVKELDLSTGIHEKLLDLTPKSWIDKNEMYQYFMNKSNFCEFVDVPQQIGRHVGLIAEDLVEVGLEDFTLRNEETGELESIDYEKLWVLLIPIIKDLKAQVADLQQQLATQTN